MVKEKNKFVLYALGFNLLLGVCTFAYFILKEKGIFTLFADFNNQQIPFNILANQAVKSGEVFWNWNIDLILLGLSVFIIWEALFSGLRYCFQQRLFHILQAGFLF